jgi:hypothetical protein
LLRSNAAYSPGSTRRCTTRAMVYGKPVLLSDPFPEVVRILSGSLAKVFRILCYSTPDQNDHSSAMVVRRTASRWTARSEWPVRAAVWRRSVLISVRQLGNLNCDDRLRSSSPGAAPHQRVNDASAVRQAVVRGRVSIWTMHRWCGASCAASPRPPVTPVSGNADPEAG